MTPEARTGRAIAGPRLAVLGNCQAQAIATCMRLLLPDAAVTHHSTYRRGRLFRRGPDPREADFAFVGQGAEPPVGPTVIPIPTLVFSAFHPDLVYAGRGGDGGGSRPVRSPVGFYNSAIALTAFRLGYDPVQAARLFRAEVYGPLGYLGFWDDSAVTLLRLGREAGFDLAPDLMRWTRRGAFMHSINHPRLPVMADVARRLLERAGIPFAACDLESCAPDELIAQGVWPIYEPVALHYGVSGSTLFLTRPEGRPRRTRTLALTAFVEGSFALYRMYRSAELTCGRVEANLGFEGLRALFKEHAGRPG